MNMNRTTEFIKKLITNGFSGKIETVKPLGRWNIEYCSKKIDNKVDLSNEDHCGPCGQYTITKKYEMLEIYEITEIENIKNKVELNNKNVTPAN